VITAVLVANRGEIALRVFRTCRDLGLRTVAVHSDADAGAPHVRAADAAVRLPGTAAADTYLRADLIVAAALRAGADAVHPGYGFLSENAAFAQAVLDAGLTWIGPQPEVIAAMGSKIAAKRTLAAAGVPVLRQLDPDALTPAELPVLIKASAGGGGRGMRVVRDLAALPRLLAAARDEALAAFGDPTVFCEPYLPRGRHVEVQVLGDAHGTVWAIGERECSIQRRHQKLVEETPSPLVQRMPGLRAQLLDAARTAASAIGYTGAGTVEFLLEDDGRFWFLEMNTRLQVEHAVTECTTGLDLVALQLQIADGLPLPEQPPQATGHAVEVRVYAEDPLHDWAPQAGTVHRFAVPGVRAQFAAGAEPSGIRLDCGVSDGSVVGPHYDALLAKVIAWAPTRAHAVRLLAGTLAAGTLHGVRTNRDLLVNVLRHPAFLAGDTDTGFLDLHGLDVLAKPLADERAERLCALAACLALDAEAAQNRPILQGIPPGWRNVPSQPRRRELDGTCRHEVAWRLDRDGLRSDLGVTLVSCTPDDVVLDGGVRHAFAVAHVGQQVFVDSSLGSVQFTLVERFGEPTEPAAAGSLLAPLPGSVARVAVAAGDRVHAGAPVLWLEAMKMQHEIRSPADGVVAVLAVRPGQQVAVGDVLAVVQPAAEGDR
jgi:propionyl-CoA carboxylase alpha chain